ncbi:MAG: hypothetical protein WC962_08625 [Phycisphaerae bacterium]
MGSTYDAHQSFSFEGVDRRTAEFNEAIHGGGYVPPTGAVEGVGSYTHQTRVKEKGYRPDLEVTISPELSDAVTKVSNAVKALDDLDILGGMDSGIASDRMGMSIRGWVDNLDMEVQRASKYKKPIRPETADSIDRMLDAFSQESLIEKARYSLNRPESFPTIERLNYLEYARGESAREGISLRKWLRESAKGRRDIASLGSTPEGMEGIATFQDMILTEADKRHMTPSAIRAEIESGKYPILRLAEVIAEKMGLDAEWATKLAKVSGKILEPLESHDIVFGVISKLEGKKRHVMVGSQQYRDLVGEATDTLKRKRTQNLGDLNNAERELNEMVGKREDGEIVQLHLQRERLMDEIGDTVKWRGQGAELAMHPVANKYGVKVPRTQSSVDMIGYADPKYFKPMEYQGSWEHEQANFFELTDFELKKLAEAEAIGAEITKREGKLEAFRKQGEYATPERKAFQLTEPEQIQYDYVKAMRERQKLLDDAKPEIPEDYWSFKLPSIIGYFKHGEAAGTVERELMSKVTNPLSKAILKAYIPRMLGVENVYRTMPLASMGFMGDYHKNVTTRMRQNGTGIADEYAASMLRKEYNPASGK